MKNKLLLQLFILILVGLLLYGVTASYDLTIDDKAHIKENVIFQQQLSPIEIFKTPTWPGNLYRPLTHLSIYLTYLTSNNYTVLLHIENVLLHISVSILAFLTLNILIGNLAGFLVSLLFLIHPLTVEVVANISNRSESLSALFFLITLFISLKINKLKIFETLLIFITFFLSLLSKESTIIGIILIPIINLYYQSKTPNRDKSIVLKLFIILFTASLLYLIIRTSVVGLPDNSLKYSGFIDNIIFDQSFIQRLPYVLRIFGDYILLILYPLNILTDYSYPQYNFSIIDLNINNILICLIPLGLAVYLLCKIKSKSDENVFLLWFILASFLASNFIMTIGTHFATRLMYLPSIGFLSVLILNIQKLNKNLNKNLIISVFMLLFGINTFFDIQKWKNDASIIFDDIARGGKSFKTNNSYANYLFNLNRFDEALEYALRSYNAYPDLEPNLSILQRIYLQKNDLSNAEKHLTTLLKINPNSKIALDGFGWLRFSQGNYQESEDYFNKSLLIDKTFPPSLIGLFSIAVKRVELFPANELLNRIDLRYRKDPRFIDAFKQYSVRSSQLPVQ